MHLPWYFVYQPGGAAALEQKAAAVPATSAGKMPVT
jgi:hypothetical protein